jgi:hypothetical protein
MKTLAVWVMMSWALLGQTGPFGTSTDVGQMGQKGETQWEAGTGTYRLTASGANIWGAVDGFHFVWKQVAGDVTISSGVEWATAGG